MQDAILTLIRQELINYIPFYFLMIGVLLYDNRNDYDSKKALHILLFICILISFNSICEYSIGQYIDNLSNSLKETNYLTLVDYCAAEGIDSESLISNRQTCLSLSYCLKMIYVLHLYYLTRISWKKRDEFIVAIPCVIGCLCFILPFINSQIFSFDHVNLTCSIQPLFYLMYIVIIFYVVLTFIEFVKNRATVLEIMVFFYLTIGVVAISLLKNLNIININHEILDLILLISIIIFDALIENKLYLIRYTEQETALTESRIDTMTNQIRPHFIFNCISNIAELINDKSPAKKALMNFAKYLRINLNSLNKADPMPFENELEYVQNYIYLEQLRYPVEFKMIYNIKSKNFLVPLVSIEVFVENAVKHNILRKKGTITVELKTYETEDYYVVEVIDDGVGFDSSQISDNGKFVGTYNASYRLEKMVNAIVDIDSKKDVGTKVMVKIPKNWGAQY